MNKKAKAILPIVVTLFATPVFANDDTADPSVLTSKSTSAYFSLTNSSDVKGSISDDVRFSIGQQSTLAREAAMDQRGGHVDSH